MFRFLVHVAISRKITIFNNEHKFVAYPHNILQEFVIDNEMIVSVPC